MADESSDGQPTRNRTPAKRRRPAQRSSGHRSWRTTHDSRYRRFNRILLLVGVLLIGAAGIITLIALVLSML